MSSNTYSRKISSKEADEGFIFILKGKLSFFPDLNDNFELIDGKLSKEVMVDSYPCTCRGPDRPHEHYFIRWEGLEAGDKIKIVADSENKGKYNLTIQK
ncbi:MAG: hypothetical protein HZC47_01395 [Methanobacterium sp.]|uniref:hypothetical protein n=1 Tax=Methanobacterium sp. TaxID=2164 RepID=UPI003D6526B9|nr:hypothetical protein [Methanobacterium sp.]